MMLTQQTPKIYHLIFLLCIFSILFISGCHTVDTLTPEQDETAEVKTEAPLETYTSVPEGKTIAEIQGNGHISPVKNRPVYNVHGIVTAIRADGFYLQSLEPDNDPATSEGVFVYEGLVPRVRPGDVILLNAVVEEMMPGGMGTGNLTITQLKNPYIEVLSSGNSLPAPVVIGEGGRIPPTEIIDDDSEGYVTAKTFFDPENDGLDFYESLEGMRVQVNQAVVVGATNQYKEIVILGDMGIHAGVRTPRGGIVVREEDFNPERIILDDSMRQMPFVQIGDYAEKPIIGVMDYTYGNYKLQPTEKVEFMPGGLLPEPPLNPATAGQIRVASYNVLNLSARDTERIEILADQIVNQLASPDIIGLQEVQDSDGSTSTLAISADETYLGIVEAIDRIGGPPYSFVDIDPEPDRDGGVPAGNIRVGFLYRTDTGLSLAEAPHGDAVTGVEVGEEAGVPVLSLNPGRIDPTNRAFFDSRKPLIVTFTINGQPLFLINNHFNSKGGDKALFGEVQPPVLESEIQRLQQAQVVHDFVDSLLEIDPASRVIVMGDLNDFQFSPPLKVLKGNILLNLIEGLPIDSQYTYVYDGNSQALDHMLISYGLSSKLVSMKICHINSEFDYMQRFSDHEVLIATFDFN